MKKLFILFVVLCLAISCKEEERRGVCTACCDPDGKEVCRGEVTDKMCAEFNKNKLDGHEWTFSEGLTICAPQPN